MFRTQQKEVYDKDKLNSEIVKHEEPDNWKMPTWKETYRKTHQTI